MLLPAVDVASKGAVRGPVDAAGAEEEEEEEEEEVEVWSCLAETVLLFNREAEDKRESDTGGYEECFCWCCVFIVRQAQSRHSESSGVCMCRHA